MPRTAKKVQDFKVLFPAGTRVYIARINETPIEDMVATAQRVIADGFEAMPHFPARLIKDARELETWIARYRDVGVSQALLLGGGADKPFGDLENSMQMMESGLFDKYGFKRLHVAGHPEGNKDIDKGSSDQILIDALRWKQGFRERTDAEMAIVTQFSFESHRVIDWSSRLKSEGIDLPIHIGVAGPAKLQTLLKFAISCGIGASLRVLRRRAMDMTKLLLPFEPDEFVSELATYKVAHCGCNISQVHFFPLGGIEKTAEWANDRRSGGTKRAVGGAA